MSMFSKLDPRDTDMVLSEVAMISSRVELYMRFMRWRALVCVFIISTVICHFMMIAAA